MWSNESINTSTLYSVINVSRSRTADFEQAVQDHTLRALPYSLTIDRSEKVDYRVDTIYSNPLVPGDYSIWTEDWMSDNTTSYLILADLVDSHIREYSDKRDNRLLEKLKGKSIPLVMAWRERKETGQLLWAAAKRISDACKVVRHPKQFVRKLYKGYTRKLNGPSLKVMERRAQKAYISFLKYRRWPKDRSPRVGDLFLQYEFAWKPLIMDIQDALDVTASTEKHLSGGSVRVNYDYSGTVTATGGRASGHELDLKCEYKLYGHQKVNWSVDSVALAALSQIQSLPSTLWDAVPYSFVVDWFVDVGSYLELRDATLGLAFKDGYKSCCVEKRYTSKPNGGQSYGAHRYVAVSAWPERYQFSFQRQILSSFPDPHLETSFERPSSLLHMAEAAALVKQALDRKL